MHFSCVTRESPEVKSSQDYNVAFRFPEKVIYNNNIYIYYCKKKKITITLFNRLLLVRTSRVQR